MTEDAVMRNGTVILQSCTVSLEGVSSSCSETSITSSDDAHGVIRIKVEEVPEPISFPTIKVEPEEVSYLSVCPLLDTSPTSINVFCIS
jgi:hypothetical protein